MTTTRIRAGGWTLVELMTALAVAGTLAAAAIPAFQRLSADSRRATVVNELLATLTWARAEAAKRGTTVIVCGIRDVDGDGALSAAESGCLGMDWSGGWLIAAWDDANRDRTILAEELTVLGAVLPRRPGADGLSIRANGLAAAPSVRPLGSAAFETFGRHSSNGTITVCDARGLAEARALIISPTGRARSSRTRADGSPLVCP